MPTPGGVFSAPALAPPYDADMKRGQRMSVLASGIAESGAGVAEVQGRRIEVTGLAPGESAEVEIEALSRHHPRAFAHLVGPIADPSTDRQEPPCPGYGTCGGCVWQHLRYPAQLRHKGQRVADALGRADVPEPWAAPAELRYRNKGSYVLGRADGSWVIGARVPRSADLVDTRGCRVVEEPIDAIAKHVGELLAGSAVEPDDGTSGLRYLLARTGVDGRAVVALVSRGPADDATQAVAAELAQRPEVATIVHVDNRSESGSVLGAATPTPLWGTGTVSESFAGVRVEVGIDSFVQVNRAQSARLYQAVADWAHEAGARKALDLYCGLGGIAFTLAAAGIEVVGVERSRDAERAQRAADDAGAARARFRRGDASSASELGADFVVVNPPRKGLSPDARATVIASAAPLVAYVSCGPESLASDVAAFADHGFSIERIQPVDLMPGTAQIETLVLLGR